MYRWSTAAVSGLLLPSIAWLRVPPRVHRSSSVETVMGSRDVRATIDSFITRQVAGDAFSGIVAVAHDGTMTYGRAAGIANRARSIPMTLDTRLQIASITKLFTQVAILQLEQSGKLSLTDTVGKYLPAYPNRTVRREVTVEQLLHHRSGIGSFWNADYVARHAGIHTVSDYMTLFDRDSLLFQPGASEEYSNGGYVVLGAIIERVSGQSYHDYVRTHIFEPAGMTGTMPYDNRHPVARAAIGYTRQSLGASVPADSRHAGVGPRPGYGPPSAVPRAVPKGPPGEPIIVMHPPTGGADSARSPEFHLRIIGADGRELGPDDARRAVAEHDMQSAERHANTATEAGTSGPAGDDYSTAADFVRFARALESHQLLDSARTAAVLGPRYRAGGDFRIAGGGPGVNAEFSIFPSGTVVVVLSNYDPPAATTVAQFIRSVLGAPAAASAAASKSKIVQAR